MNKLKYTNITISGLPGAGSSTLGKALSNILGWRYFSGGDFMRQYAIKQELFDPKTKTHHAATVYNDDFDRKVDYGMRRTSSKESGHILDSWLSGFMAQGIKKTLKILVYCSEDNIRVDRIANRDNLKIEDAIKHIFERERKNIKKWRRMYKQEWEKWVIQPGTVSASKPIWFWYPELYDLQIDTYKHSKEETLNIALSKLEFKAENLNYKKIFTPQ